MTCLKAKSRIHPLCDLFPPFSKERLEELAANIGKYGQQEPIVMLDGQVLDGKNREAAVLMNGGEPPDYVDFKSLNCGMSAAEYVFCRNLARRDLDPAQRAQIVARWKANREAEEESLRGGCNVAPRMTVAEMMKIADVSERTMKYAEKVQKKGVPEVADAVISGKVSGKRGAEISNLPPKQQLAELREEDASNTATLNKLRRADALVKADKLLAKACALLQPHGCQQVVAMIGDVRRALERKRRKSA